jgi:hypothetical protein
MAKDLCELRSNISDFIGAYGFLFKSRDPCRIAMMNIQAQAERLRVALDEEYKTFSPTDIHIYYPSRGLENNQTLS